MHKTSPPNAFMHWGIKANTLVFYRKSLTIESAKTSGTLCHPHIIRGVTLDNAKGCPYIIRDKHTGLYIRIVDCDDMPAEYEIQLTDRRELATTISGWGYALNEAMRLALPFTLERL